MFGSFVLVSRLADAKNLITCRPRSEFRNRNTNCGHRRSVTDVEREGRIARCGDGIWSRSDYRNMGCLAASSRQLRAIDR